MPSRPELETVGSDGSAQRVDVPPAGIDVRWKDNIAVLTVDFGWMGSLRLFLPRAEALRLGLALRAKR